MDKFLIAALAIAVLVGGTITAFTQAGARNNPGQVPDVAPTLTTARTQVVLPGNGANSSGGVQPSLLQDNPTVVEARVVPPKSYDLRFDTTGTIAEVMVKEGASVAKGAVLARLDTRAIDLDIKAAEAELAEAHANYDRLLAGAPSTDIAQVQAQLTRAQAQLKQTQKTVSAQDLAAAQRLIDALKVKQAALEAKPSKEDIAVAKANLDEAKLKLQSDRDTFSAKKTTMEAQLQQVANRLRDLQDAYRRIKQDNDKSSNLSQDDKDTEAKALRAVQNAEQDVKVAQVQLDEARQIETTAVAAAEGRVGSAQALYNSVLASKPIDEIATTQAQIAEAEAALNKLQGEFRAAQIELGKAEIGVSQADLDKVQALPRQVDRASLEARIKYAEVQLQQRRFAMDHALLRAPVAGTVARFNLNIGQVIFSEQVIGVLADTSSWQVQATDLSELVVVGLKPGDEVVVTFYAIPGLQLTGTIDYVQTIGETVRGQDTTYGMFVKLDKFDERLRWNMTATVRILPRK